MQEKIFDDWSLILDRVLNKIKTIIDTGKFDNIIILIETDNKLPDNITLKKVVTLITCVIKAGEKFCQQLFLEVLVA